MAGEQFGDLFASKFRYKGGENHLYISSKRSGFMPEGRSADSADLCCYQVVCVVNFYLVGSRKEKEVTKTGVTRNRISRYLG